MVTQDSQFDLAESLGDDGSPSEPATPIDPDPLDPGRPNPNNPAQPDDIPNVPFGPNSGFWPPELDGGTTDEGVEGSATFSIPLPGGFGLIGGLGGEAAFPDTGRPDLGDFGDIGGLVDEMEINPFGRAGIYYWSDDGRYGVGGIFEDREGSEGDTFGFGGIIKL